MWNHFKLFSLPNFLLSVIPDDQPELYNCKAQLMTFKYSWNEFWKTITDLPWEHTENFGLIFSNQIFN